MVCGCLRGASVCINIQIALHDSHEVPLVRELGVAVSPGQQLNMLLQKATVSPTKSYCKSSKKLLYVDPQKVTVSPQNATVRHSKETWQHHDIKLLHVITCVYALVTIKIKISTVY